MPPRAHAHAEPLLGGSRTARAREAAVVGASLLAGLLLAGIAGGALWYCRPPPPGSLPAPRKGAAAAVVWERAGGGDPSAPPSSPRLVVWSGKGHNHGGGGYPPPPGTRPPPVAIFTNLDDGWSLGGLVDGDGGRKAGGGAWTKVARLEGGAGAGAGAGAPPSGAPLVEPAPRWKAVAAGTGGLLTPSLLLFGGDAQVSAGGATEDDYLGDAWRLTIVGGGSEGGGHAPACRWPWPLPCHATPDLGPPGGDPPAAVWEPLLPSRSAAPYPRRAAAGAVVGSGDDGTALVIAGGRPAHKGDGLFGDVWAFPLGPGAGGARSGTQQPGAVPPGPPGPGATRGAQQQPRHASSLSRHASWARLFPPPGCSASPGGDGRDEPAVCDAAWAGAPRPRKGAAGVSAPAGLVTPGPALLLFGGRTDGDGPCYFGDAWAFDVQSRMWTRLDRGGSGGGGGGGGGGGDAPAPARDHAGALLDPLSSPPRLLVFGGRGGDTYAASTPLPLDEVWALPLVPGGGAAWERATKRAAPDPKKKKKPRKKHAPAPRFLFGFDSFTHANRTFGVVMGGEGEGGVLHGDAWLYEVGSGEWVRVG